MLTYLLELTVCWTLLYGIFFLCMRRETFFKINRWYLLSALLLGLVIPLLRFIPIIEEVELYNRQIAEYAPIVYVIKDTPSIVAHSITEQSIEWGQVFLISLLALYVLGFGFFLFRFIKGLTSIKRLYQEGEKTNHKKHTLINTSGKHLPFSFLNMIFVSKDLPLNEDYNRIITHELEHVRARHSIDVLFLEIINIVFWFHPMIYLYKSALRQTHEYLADAAVCGNDSRQLYGQLLLRQSLSGLEIALAHHFFHSHIKKRINMIYQEKSGRKAWLKYALAVPALAILLLVFTSHNTIKKPLNQDINIYNDIPVLYNSPKGPKFNFFLDDEFQNIYKGIDVYLSKEEMRRFGVHLKSDKGLLSFFNPEGFLLQTEDKEIHIYRNSQNEWQVKYESPNNGKVNFIVLGNDNIKIKELSIQKNKRTLIFQLSELKISIPIFQLQIEQGGERLDMKMVSFHNVQESKTNNPTQKDFEEIFENNPNGIPEKKLSRETKQILQQEISDEDKVSQLESLYRKWLTKYPKEKLRIKDIISWTGYVNRRKVWINQVDKVMLQKPNYYLPVHPEALTKDYRIELANTLIPNYKEIELEINRVNENPEIGYLQNYLKWQGLFHNKQDARQEIHRLFKKYAQDNNIDLGFNLKELNIQYNVTAPKSLKGLIDQNADPVFWGNGQYTAKLVDNFKYSEPIGMYAYLPPKYATKLFGNDGKHGFVAMSFYTIGDKHPYRIKQSLNRDIKNFFSTIDQLPESAWIHKLKEVQADLSTKYGALYDYYDPITPFSNIAHAHNITLVFNEGKIIKAYRGDGNSTERIDNDRKRNLYPTNVKVSSEGKELKVGKDYKVDNTEGKIKILNKSLLDNGKAIRVEFDENKNNKTRHPDTYLSSKIKLSNPFIKSIYENFIVPEDLRNEGIEGAVVVLMSINENNKIDSYRIPHSLDERLTLAAETTMENCKDLSVLKESTSMNPSQTYALNFIIEHDEIINERTDSLLSIVKKDRTIYILDELKMMYFYEAAADLKSNTPNKSKSSSDLVPDSSYIIGGLLGITNAPKDLAVIVNGKHEKNPDENIDPSDVLSIRALSEVDAISKYPELKTKNIVEITTKDNNNGIIQKDTRDSFPRNSTSLFDTIITYYPDTFEETIEIIERPSNSQVPTTPKNYNGVGLKQQETKTEQITFDQIDTFVVHSPLKATFNLPVDAENTYILKTMASNKVNYNPSSMIQTLSLSDGSQMTIKTIAEDKILQIHIEDRDKNILSSHIPKKSSYGTMEGISLIGIPQGTYYLHVLTNKYEWIKEISIPN